MKHLDFWVPGVPLDRHPLVYAECQGPHDPVCGRARFSTHKCGGKGKRPTFG